MSLMYLGIFMAITVFYATTADSPSEKAFNMEKCKVAIIDNDNSSFSKGLNQLLEKNTRNIVLSERDKENLKDVLFFRIAECIYTVPHGFEDGIKSGSHMQLQTMTIPDSSVSAMVNQMVNKYITTVSMYTIDSKLDMDTAVKYALVDLEKEVKVNIENDTTLTSYDQSLIAYFNYLVYPLVAIMILTISTTMIKLNKRDLKRRNICSPMPMSKFNMELFLANICISIIIFILFVILTAVVFKSTMFTIKGMLLIINTLIFTICCLSMSFLIAEVANEKTVSPISTIFSLMSSFIGGSFVPQSMLSSTVKSIGNFVPSFWYVKGNNLVSNVSTLNFQSLKPYMTSLLVQICFAVAFLAIALVIIKQKRTSEQ